jgi:CHAT domain-containing protein/tetratricopeptide (TPR) repeat protein
LKKFISLLFILFFTAFENYSRAQVEDINNIVQRFLKFYNSGDIINAEKCLLRALDSDFKIPYRYEVYIYTNLGVSNTLLGRYSRAMNYYNLAEKSIYTKTDSAFYLSIIYVNKAIIYGYQKSYLNAIEYFEKGIRNYLGIKNPDNRIRFNISAAYLNIGIIFYETGEYKIALKYLEKSKEIKSKYKLPETAFIELNIAKTYVKLFRFKEAGEFFQSSIDLLINEFGQDYYRLAEFYFEYGQFLYASGRYDESLGILNKASSICLKNYGEKHSLTSYSYKLIGDYYKNQSDFNTALKFYQKSLNSIVSDFNNPDIFTNPSADSSIFDIRLLDNLKCKAQGLELLSGEQDNREMKLKTLDKSLETIDLALQLIDRIRNNYLTEESRIYLAENEKDTWFSAIHIANSLYTLTNDNSLIQKMYSIVQRAKAAVLRNEISEKDLLYSSSVPDSLIEKQNTLAENIAAYNKLILEESQLTNPDSSKISLWKDALFEMKRRKEKVSDEIDRQFPQYHDLLLKTEPLPLSDIQKKLERDETVIDYMLSNQYSGGKRKLYIFVITGNSLEFRETNLDSAFVINAEIIRKGDDPAAHAPDSKTVFINYTRALSFMYENLFKLVENLAEGKRIIIIPDEEIAWLPFEAFLTKLPQPYQEDYEGLQYLIYDYTFTNAYSSPLIFSNKRRLKRGEEVLAFSPDYSNSNFEGTNIGKLRGAEDEIGSIYKWFRGRKFTGDQATETNFRKALNDPAIFHLAMHSISDTVNSKYSFLLFDTKNDTAEDGRLYNYEINLTRITSPMVVLSACNSGTGTLYHGEGLMSLARSFILAGASSVIKTSWEVNDEVSAAIITRFYYYLSRGNPKDEAMRFAKIEYIRKNPPLCSNPYYWAAYEVVGDNTRVTRNKCFSVIIFSVIVILAAGFAVFYLRRRRIFSARSL